MITQTEFSQRRQQVIQQMAPNSIAMVAAASELHRNNDTEHRYRQNSDFYYLTGFNEPDAIALFIPGREQGEYVLFNREKNPAMEVWTGHYAGQQGAVDQHGADESYAIEDIDEVILDLLAGKQRIYYHIASDPEMDTLVMQWTRDLQAKVRGGVGAPTEFVSLSSIVHEMRLIKSGAEQQLMHKAADIAVEAHKRAWQSTQPAMREYEVQAEIEYVFKKHGCVAPAYGSIVAGGNNACTLHYVDNNDTLNDGDLVLIDAGCEYEFYASDITRTYPVNGKFSAEQKALYNVALTAQLAVIDLIKPGTKFGDLQKLACQKITEGLIALGIINASLETALAEEQYKTVYMHNISHWIGIDVHDVGDYKIDGEWRELQPGMCLTVEPGIYIADDNTDVEAKWRGIGIRIEDDVLVTEQSADVLTCELPKTVEEIEAFMAG
tara:strand:+ start:37446 stop:38756 length:1311 start_codon:yes stop_codon:yes gene_type:complete